MGDCLKRSAPVSSPLGSGGAAASSADDGCPSADVPAAAVGGWSEARSPRTRPRAPGVSKAFLSTSLSARRPTSSRAVTARRGAVPLRVVLNGEQRIEIAMHTVALDAAFDMKAALVAGGLRARADRRITDTTDAVLLAAAAVHPADAVQALHVHRRHGEVKVALRWLAKSFDSPRSAMPRRLADHFADPAAAEWAVDAAAALSAAVNRRRGPHGR